MKGSESFLQNHKKQTEKHMLTKTLLTFAAILPHAQVDLRNVVTAAVAMRKLCHTEDIPLDACDVVPVVTQHPCQGRLLQLGQLGGSEHAWVLVPESEQDGGGR